MKKSSAIFFLIVTLSLFANLCTAQYTTPVNFDSASNPQGREPQGNVILVGGRLYGMTNHGGAHDDGVIFSVDSNGGGYKDLWDFHYNSGNNGANPSGSLVNIGNKLYGMTFYGGLSSAGTIFRIDTDGSGYTDLWNFQFGNAGNGADPFGSLLLSGDKFYGITYAGGQYHYGNVFSIDTNGSNYKNLWVFADTGTSGWAPRSTPIIAGNKLYGMTYGGGLNGNYTGTIFSIDTNGTGFKDVWNFSPQNYGNSNGSDPSGSLLLIGNKLYGMSDIGGTNELGNLFSIDTNGTGYKDLVNFNYTTGAYPSGSLVFSGGLLYGTTSYAGKYGYGNIFSVDTDGTGFKQVFSFNNTDGAGPDADILISGNVLYGTTNNGGTHNDGVVFRLAPITLTNTDTNILCNGTNTGRATIYVQGGNAPFTYSWAPSGGTNSSNTALTAGNYTVTVTDNTGVSATVSVSITQPTLITTTTSVLANVSCNGGNNGSVSSGSVSGGITPYTYLWSDANSQTTTTATSLSAGTYTLTVKDANGCAITRTATITQPNTLISSPTIIANEICYGGTDGSINANVSGGTTPYTYLWGAGQTTNIITGLSAGIYTVAVTDINNCNVTASATITQAAAALAVGNPTINSNVPCNGGTGIATSAIPTGGNTPYTYLWNGGASGTSPSNSSLSVGTYTVTITDATGCTINAVNTITITQPATLAPIITSQTNILCFGGSGSITASAAGGTSPYSYSWAPGGSTNTTISNLSVGSYSVTIIDANGCSASTSTTITSPASSVSIAIASQTNIICNGSNTGSATADNATGGVASYNDLLDFGYYNGYNPQGSLLQVGNILYGMNSEGGAYGAGNIFSYNKTTNVNTDLYDFDGYTGYFPYGSLIISGNTLYGMTVYSGPNYQGNIFSFNISTNTYTDRFDFNGTNGNNPYGDLTLLGTKLYGMTQGGGSGYGNIFSFDTATNAFTNLYNFDGLTGANPTGSLTAKAGTLYGMTDYGGIVSVGNIFSFDTAGSVFTDLHDFTGTDGQYPTGSLTLSGNTLYGFTEYGGIYNQGNILSFNINGNIVTDLFDFHNTNGGQPQGSLTLSGTSLYGMTYSGGANNIGDVFSFDTVGNVFTDLLDFNGTNGANPTSNSLVISGNTLYGMTFSGGAHTYYGVAFSLNTKPYSYVWSPGGGTKLTTSNLTAGTYTITATDVNGCNATASVTITQPATLAANANATANIVCNGGNNGSAQAAPTGGTMPYTYLWNDANSQATATATGLSAGSYTIAISDANGCSASSSITITQPNVLGISLASVNNILCFGGTGSIVANLPTGGTSPYTYVWSPGGSTNLSISNLSAGSYSIAVTDANGCSASTYANISSPASALGIAILSQTNVSCPGGTKGSATADTATGGTTPYNDLLDFNYTNGYEPDGSLLQVGNILYGMTSGGGANGKGNIFSYNKATNVSTDLYDFDGVTGYGPSGSLIISGNTLYGMTEDGGGGPYYYGNIFSFNLSTNTYTDLHNFNGTDGNEPRGDLTLLGTKLYGMTLEGGINNNGLIFSFDTLTHIVTDLVDFSNAFPSGSLTLSGTTFYGMTQYGGAPGFGNIFSFDTVGSVYTDLYDFDGTTGNDPTGGLTLSGTTLYGVTEQGGVTNNGNIFSFNTSGNVFTDLFDFNNTNGQYPEGTLILSGTTFYGMTEYGGASGSGTVFSFDTTGSVLTDLLNFNGTNGKEPVLGSLALSGNTLYGMTIWGNNYNGNMFSLNTHPYSYVWSPSGGTNLTASNLSAGTYTITATDVNGCNATATVTITQPATLAANATISTNISCHGGNNGAAKSIPTGGASPYTYLWSSGETTSTISGKSANTYTVTVHDSCGGSASASVAITQPYPLTGGIYAGRPETCIPGYATVSVNGGRGPYTYLWNPGSETSATASGLTAGVYTVTVTDANGCAMVPSPTLTTTIGYNPLRDSTVHVTENSCGQTMSGTATVGVKGGQTPYTYLWSNAATAVRITALSSGSYSVTVTDNNGCTATASVAITTLSGLTLSMGSLTNISCYGASDGSAGITVSGGAAPYTYTWPSNISTTSSATGLAPISYMVTIKDHNGCFSEISFSITQPAALAAVIAAKTNASCVAGSATVSASGGSTPYTYLWSPGSQTNATASGLSAGTYTVALTDAHGCSLSLNTTIGYNPLRDSISASTPNICGNAAIATVTVGVKGGTAPYTYVWSDASSQTTATATGLSAGTYSVTVKDAMGCSVPTLSTLIKNDILRDSISAITQNLCGNESSATLTVGIKGGVTPYTFTWSNGATTQHITLLSNGTYSVSVSDKNGCSVTASATITSPAVLTASLASLTEVSCYGANNGSASVTVTGGVPPYTYSWPASVSTTSSATGLKPVSYACNVKDHNGCSSQVTIYVTQPPNLVSSITNASCTLTAHTSGGTPPYTYLWAPGGQSSSSVAESNGTYTVTTTDNNGCSSTASHLVTGCPVASIEYATDKKAPDDNADALPVTTHVITVYPDPSKGQFTIAGLDKDMLIEIYDYTGKIIRSLSANDTTMQLSIADRANGIYLIRILSKEGALISQKKLIKTQ